MYEVYKDGVCVYIGSDFNCYKFILNHQPQSVYYAETYGGWELKKKSDG